MGSVGCRVYSKCHQILNITMLVFSSSLHYWLKNGSESDLVRCFHVSGPWRRQGWGAAVGLMGSTSMMILPLLILPANPSSLQGKDGLSLTFSDFFPPTTPSTCLVCTTVLQGGWVGYSDHLQMKERTFREVGNLYITVLGSALPSDFCKLQFSH